jgi:hypothetical protein
VFRGELSYNCPRSWRLLGFREDYSYQQFVNRGSWAPKVGTNYQKLSKTVHMAHA